LKAIHILQKWFLEKMENPYPTPEEKDVLSIETGMTVKQVDFRFFIIIIDIKLVHKLQKAIPWSSQKRD